VIVILCSDASPDARSPRSTATPDVELYEMLEIRTGVYPVGYAMRVADSGTAHLNRFCAAQLFEWWHGQEGFLGDLVRWVCLMLLHTERADD
jgi:hypothetical protein